MKSLAEIQTKLTEYKPLIQEKYQIIELGIFDTDIPEKARQEGDINVLIDYIEAPSLLDLVDLELALSEKLGVKVHVITKNGLKGTRRARILAETLYL